MGPGTRHQAERKKWIPVIDAGNALCARCGRPIVTGTPWDLDHSDDRGGYLGPAHRACNRGHGSGRRRGPLDECGFGETQRTLMRLAGIEPATSRSGGARSIP
jgi:hypothetical protein